MTSVTETRNEHNLACCCCATRAVGRVVGGTVDPRYTCKVQRGEDALGEVKHLRGLDEGRVRA